MNTVNDLYDMALAHSHAKQDFQVDAKHLIFANDGTVAGYAPNGSTHFEGARMTTHSFGALLGFAKGTKKTPIAHNINRARAYLQEDCPPDMMAMQMNHWLSKMWHKGLKIRNIVPGVQGINYGKYEGGLHIRHVASNSYSCIDSHNVLDWLSQVFSQIDYKLGGCSIGIDKMHLRIQIPQLDTVVPREEYGGGHHSFGLYISNGETGNGRYIISMYMNRTACDNSTLLLQQDYGRALQHRFVTPQEAMHFTYGTIQNLLRDETLTQRIAERLNESTTVEVPNPGKTIAAILKNRGVSEKLAPYIAAESNRYGHTKAGLANGFNWVAHQGKQLEQEVDEDTRATLEAAAGDIIMSPAAEFFRNVDRSIQRLAVGED